MVVVYLVRHGHYDLMTGSLSEQGKREIKTTAEIIRDENDDKLLILYSPAKRTRESAEVMKEVLEELDVELKECPRLAIGNLKAKEVISDHKDNKVLVLITHQPIIEDFLSNVGIYRLIKTGDYVKLNIE